jgi:hypothetical protein
MRERVRHLAHALQVGLLQSNDLLQQELDRFLGFVLGPDHPFPGREAELALFASPSPTD